MPMTVKLCKNCNVECWHNPSPKADTPPRCTYCGYPPQGSTDKKAVMNATATRQQLRAKTLGITRMGIW